MYFTVLQTPPAVRRASWTAPRSSLLSTPPVLTLGIASAHRCCTWQESSVSSSSASSWKSAGQRREKIRSLSRSSRSPSEPLRRTTVGFKHTWMLGRRYNMNVTYKIFCGWDFTIQDPDSGTLKQSVIRNDLKVMKEDRVKNLQLQLSPFAQLLKFRKSLRIVCFFCSC